MADAADPCATASRGAATTVGLKILVVDDQPFQLKLVELLLQQAFPDAHAYGETEPLRALERVGTQKFDCVIVDFQMPDMDGLEFSRRLREVEPYLPVILCTGGGDEMLVAEAMTNGVTQYLPKTRVSPDSLRRTVSHAVQITCNDRLISEQRAELEHFAYALAHDFKQPLRQIKTFSKLIRTQLGEGDAADLEAHARYLEDAAERLGRLVDVMSQYALLGKTPKLERVPLGRLFEDLRAVLGAYVDERKGMIVGSSSDVVLGNDTLVFQIVQNLVVNGLKYNTQDVPRVELSSRLLGTACEIRVRDNGIGIPEAFREKVFQPLTRLHRASEYEGSGLGLALARKAARSLGGSVRCESVEGRGSEFIVTLPTSDPAATVASSAGDAA